MFGGLGNNYYLCSLEIEIACLSCSLLSLNFMFLVMGKADRKITRVVTDEGNLLYRRVTEVLMPNGKCRYPVDYFDATPGVVKVSKDEMHKLAIPVYDITI